MDSRHNSSDHYPTYSNYSNMESAATYGNTERRASFDDGILEPKKAETGREVRQSTPSRKLSNQEDDKLYQNIHPSTPQRSSPTKKSQGHFSQVSVPVPEGYYNLTPPPLVRRHNNSNNVSPSSSPEESSLSLFNPHTVETPHGQELSIVGDSLIMNKSSHPLSKTLSPPSEGTDIIGGTYQNVEFMRTDNQGAKWYVPEIMYSPHPHDLFCTGMRCLPMMKSLLSYQPPSLKSLGVLITIPTWPLPRPQLRDSPQHSTVPA